MSFPIVLGHECAGVVEKLGEGVTKVALGDRVVLRPQQVCGKCRPCREGRYNICESLKVLGCQCTGGSSDFYVAKEELFYKIPDQIGFGEGTMIEPLSVGVHAVKRIGDVKGKKVLITGSASGIGRMLAGDMAKKVSQLSFLSNVGSDRRDVGHQRFDARRRGQ